MDSTAIASTGQQSRPLATLAEEINSHHRLAESAARSCLDHALAAGRLLLEVKAQSSHGEWAAWVEANCEFSRRTAQAYMRVAKRWPEIEAKAQSSADLTIDGALKLLAPPKPSLRDATSFEPDWKLHEEWYERTEALQRRLDAVDAMPVGDAKITECHAIETEARRLVNEAATYMLDMRRAAGRLLSPRRTTHWDDRLIKVAPEFCRRPMCEAHRGALTTPWDGVFVVFGNRGDLEVPILRDVLAEHKCEELAYTSSGDTQLDDGTPAHRYWAMLVRGGGKIDKQDPADHLYTLVWHAWLINFFGRKPDVDERGVYAFVSVQDRVARKVLSEHSKAIVAGING